MSPRPSAPADPAYAEPRDPPPDLPTAAERRVACPPPCSRTSADAGGGDRGRLIERLAAAGITAVVPEADADILTAELKTATVLGATPEQLSAPTSDVELMLVLGGDGTILRGAEKAITSDTPMLGVNLGHVGFLAEAEAAEIDSIVEHVVNRTTRSRSA